MPSTSAGSNIINGPTITGISSLPINMMTISIESNIGAPDADIFISATDSTAQSIPTSAASIHSTEVRCCLLVSYLVHCFNIFTSLCSLRIILVGENLIQVWFCVCIS